MKNIIIILLSFYMMPTFSAIPTVEGLFRNINNKDIEGAIAVLSFKVQEQARSENNESNTPDSESVEDAANSKAKVEKYVKIFLSIENPERIEYLKIEYNGQSMSRSGVSNVTYYPNVLEKMNNDKIIERELFTSMINMFALNDSRGMSQFLTRYNKDYYSNKLALNEKKIILYNKYKVYLQKINEQKELKDELQSPLKNEDPEKRLEIKKTLKDSMYMKSSNVFMHREGNKFFWKVSLDTTNAIFDNDNLKLRQLEFNNGGGTIDLRIGEYILFDGIHELPKIIYFKDLLERVYKIRFLKYKLFSKLTKTIEQRYIEMKEELVINKKTKEAIETKEGVEKIVTEETPEPFFY
jgi:hypothetical protein